MYYDKLFKNFPIIEDDDILLKQIEKQDLNDYVEINMNEVLYRFAPGEPRKTIAAVENIIGHHERDFYKKKIINLGVYLKKYNNKMVGVAQVFDFDNIVNVVTIGYTLNQNYWGQGIATKTTALLIKYLFNEIDVNRIQAFVMPQNEKSKMVLSRNKFMKEGTIRQGNYWRGRGVVDLEVYSILKSEYSYIEVK